MNLEEETLILFSSDHGATFEVGNQGTSAYYYSNHPFRGGKRTLYEGGIRVPLIARWPGRIQGGTSSGQLAHAIDLFPTLIAAAGGKPDPSWKLDGVNLLPEWTAGATLPERELYWEWRQEGSPLRGSPIRTVEARATGRHE